jgi:hypothetical protein
MDCNIYRTKPIKGSGYLTYCLLPFNTQSVINVWNHVSQVGSYRKYENEIKIDSFPVHINDVKKIERSNNNISINVFSLEINKSLEENCELEPLYLSKNCENAINILYYENHYLYIKNINSFFRTNKTNACHLCFRCLNSFSSKTALLNHKLKCEEHNYCKIITCKPWNFCGAKSWRICLFSISGRQNSAFAAQI